MASLNSLKILDLIASGDRRSGCHGREIRRLV